MTTVVPPNCRILRERKAVVAVAFALLAATYADQAFARRAVEYESGLPSGAILISQSAKTLYLILNSRSAIAYPVAVAKRGMEWSGSAHVQAKFVEPAWSPPDSVKRDHPELPEMIRGGSPHNPMGARAILLDRDEIAIHGTTQSMRGSVGTAASYGCIRMYNEDVIDLFDRVTIGAPVFMTR
jgi:lipoprotein-anchoring transpeptidase ErfK/SrfK